MLTQRIRLVALAAALGLPAAAHAGYWELSGNGAYYKYDNGVVGNVDSTTTVTKWGGGLAYRFLTNTAIELSYTVQKTVDVYGQETSSDISFDVTKTNLMKTTSLDLVLDFADKKSRFRPFIRGGGGYVEQTQTLNVTQIDSQGNTQLPKQKYKAYAASANAGLGFKIFVAEIIAIEASFNMVATDLDKSAMRIFYSGAGGLRIVF